MFLGTEAEWKVFKGRLKCIISPTGEKKKINKNKLKRKKKMMCSGVSVIFRLT